MKTSMILAALLGTIALAGCVRPPPVMTAANVDNGRLLLRQFGCGACHRIPGVANADGIVGPSLAGIANRVYIAGFMPNTADNMVAWIRAPRSLDPRTAMPDLQVTEQHARDMTAYLYSLR